MMKKLPVVLLVMATFVYSCNQKQKDSTSVEFSQKGQFIDPPKPVTLGTSNERSLNGIDKSVVINMADDFEEKSLFKVSPPSKYSIWFDKKVVLNIYNLLDSEKRVEKIKVDGIRVYFLGNNTPKTPNFALVSTKNGGKDTVNRNKHIDYYTHNINRKLFLLGDTLKGIISIDSCDGGAVLYGKCRDGKCNTPCSTDKENKDDILTRSIAESMAQHNGGVVFNTKSIWFGLNLIKTFKEIIENKPDKISGIRIYLANYNRKIGGKPRSSRKLMRYTFLITPTTLTKINQKDVHKDIFNCKAAKSLKQQTEGDGGFNNGELCPNNCNVDDEGGTGDGNKNVRLSVHLH